MNKPNEYVISPIEMSVSLISMVIGVGILTLPRALASELETADGWLSIILGGVITMVLVTLFVRIQRHFPGKTLLQFLAQGKLGKWLVYGLSIPFIIYFVSLTAYEARILAIVTKMYLLDQTPTEILIALLLLTTAYAVSKGIQGIVHLNIMFVPIIIIVLLSVQIFNMGDAKIAKVLPVFAEGIAPILSGVKVTMLSFLGIEIIFFLMANMKQKDIKAYPLNIAIGFIAFLYVLTTLITYGIFTVDATMLITFPTVELAKEIEIPGAFFERLESLMITVWTMTIFNTMAIAQLITVQIINNHFMKKESKLSAYLPALLIFILYLLSFIPNSITEASAYGEWVAWLGIILYVASIIFGYITLWLRKNISRQRKGVATG